MKQEGALVAYDERCPPLDHRHPGLYALDIERERSVDVLECDQAPRERVRPPTPRFVPRRVLELLEVGRVRVGPDLVLRLSRAEDRPAFVLVHRGLVAAHLLHRADEHLQRIRVGRHFDAFGVRGRRGTRDAGFDGDGEGHRAGWEGRERSGCDAWQGE